MDIAIVEQLINSFGFPIVCCAAMFWYMIKQETRHKEEIDKLAEAVNNNTNIITKLYEILTKGE